MNQLLLKPATLEDVENEIDLPRALFSHNDQQKSWQTSVPDSAASTGWGGRLSDQVNNLNQPGLVSMNISLGQTNIYQSGGEAAPYVVSSGGASLLRVYRPDASRLENQVFTNVTDTLLAQPYPNLMKQTHADLRRSAIDTSLAFDEATEGVTLETAFPDSSLGDQFAMVARTIAARDTLGQKRQTFYVTMGGFDNHDELLNTHDGLMATLNEALFAFYNATVELGVENQVTSFTASDFGRTLTSNGRGSDHAWGGNQPIMGGAVSGGEIYGQYPTDLQNASDDQGASLDIGRGRLLPTTSTDEYYAELARWFGVANDNTMEQVLPNIRNFYAAGESNPPIGFFEA